MTDEFRNLIESKRNVSAKDSAQEEVVELVEEFEEERACFSVVSADRMRKVMLELRFKDGNSEALAYSYLLGASFNPSRGILLDFGGKTATISGWNLRPLYDALVGQRVAWVRELASPHAEVTIPENDVRVSRIEVVEPA